MHEEILFYYLTGSQYLKMLCAQRWSESSMQLTCKKIRKCISENNNVYLIFTAMFCVCLYYIFTDDLYKQYMVQLKKYTLTYYVCAIIIYNTHI